MKRALLFLLISLYFLLLQPTGSLAAVIINEIAWMGTASSSNDEWIELFNSSQQPIAIDNWVLKSTDEKLKINLKGNIPQQGFFLLERTDDQTVPNIAADLIYKGSLSDNGKALILTDNNNVIIDQVNCQNGWLAGDKKTEQTMEMTSNNIWQTSQKAGGTPKQTNSQGITNNQEPITNDQLAMSEALLTTSTPASSVVSSASASTSEVTERTPLEIAPIVSGLKEIVYPKNIFINEILPAPEGPDDKNEWVEIFNANDFAVVLSDWQLKDTVGAIKTYTLPEDSQIPAKGFLLISRAESKITLQNTGDGLEFLNPKEEIIHQLNYETAPKGQSFNRKGETWQWSAVLTPGKANIFPSPQSNAKENSQDWAKKEGEEISSSNANYNQDKNKKMLANIEKTMPQPLNPVILLLAALGIAIASGVIVLMIKKRAE